MKRVVCFGEAIIDFLNTGQGVEGILSLNKFTQFPGGAPANAAVAVAKLGGDSLFAGQVGSDQFGRFLIDSLKIYGVDTRYICQHPTASTTLAFVFLDEHGERSFSFYRDRTADIIFTQEQVSENWFEGDALFHFCSNTLTNTGIAKVTKHALKLARNNDALISFDVNLRHNLWASGKCDANVVNELVYQSDLVKFSSEEIDYLSDGDRTSYLAHCFDAGVSTVLITDGGKNVLCLTPSDSLEISPPFADVVDTTGGGDAFIGAVLFGLSRQDKPLNILRKLNELKPIVEFAIYCGAFTVSKKGAFPALPTLEDVIDKWKS